jgi:hypothetical protein
MVLEKLAREPEITGPAAPVTATVASLPMRYRFLRIPRLGPSSNASEKALLLELFDLAPQDADAAVAALARAEESLTDQLEAFLGGHLHLTASHRLYERETICSVRPGELVFHRLVALVPDGEVEAEDFLPVEALTAHPYRILRARLPRPFDRRRGTNASPLHG